MGSKCSTLASNDKHPNYIYNRGYYNYGTISNETDGKTKDWLRDPVSSAVVREKLGAEDTTTYRDNETGNPEEAKLTEFLMFQHLNNYESAP